MEPQWCITRGAYHGNSAWHGGYYNGGYHGSNGYNNNYNHSNYNSNYNGSNYNKNVSGNADVQLPSHFRVLAFSGTQQGVGFPYQQWYVSAGLGYQWRFISRLHLENIDPDKDHHFVFGGGYEFLRTIHRER